MGVRYRLVQDNKQGPMGSYACFAGVNSFEKLLYYPSFNLPTPDVLLFYQELFNNLEFIRKVVCTTPEVMVKRKRIDLRHTIPRVVWLTAAMLFRYAEEEPDIVKRFLMLRNKFSFIEALTYAHYKTNNHNHCIFRCHARDYLTGAVVPGYDSSFYGRPLRLSEAEQLDKRMLDLLFKNIPTSPPYWKYIANTDSPKIDEEWLKQLIEKECKCPTT